MDDERIDLSYNDEAKCPYCGFDDYDCWELDIDDGAECTTGCPSCGKEYGVMRNIEITYTTWPLENKEPGDDESESSNN